MRVLKLFLAGIFSLALAGCAAYHLGPVNGATAGDRSVTVLPFNNQTLQPRLGDSLTQSLRQRIQSDGTYQLTTHGVSDVVVSGVIRTYDRRALGYLSTDASTPEDFRIEAV